MDIRINSNRDAEFSAWKVKCVHTRDGSSTDTSIYVPKIILSLFLSYLEKKSTTTKDADISRFEMIERVDVRVMLGTQNFWHIK